MSAYSSPYDVNSSYSTIKNGVNGPVLTSLIGHIIILLLIIFGIPFIAKNPEILYEPIPVEIISSSDLKDIQKPVEQPKEIEPPPMKKQAPTLVEPEPEPLPEPEPIKEELVPEPVEPPPPIETPESEVKEEPEPKKPTMKPTPKPKPPPKKEIEKPKDEPKPKNDMAALLKNLTVNEPAPAVTQTDVKESAPRKGATQGTLSMSDRNKLIAQLSKCWYVQAGSKYAEELAVDLDLVVRTDRTVQSVDIVDSGRYNRDPVFRAAADAARRAVTNPNCSPLDLPPEKYNEWKYLPLRFDPKDML